MRQKANAHRMIRHQLLFNASSRRDRMLGLGSSRGKHYVVQCLTSKKTDCGKIGRAYNHDRGDRIAKRSFREMESIHSQTLLAQPIDFDQPLIRSRPVKARPELSPTRACNVHKLLPFSLKTMAGPTYSAKSRSIPFIDSARLP